MPPQHHANSVGADVIRSEIQSTVLGVGILELNQLLADTTILRDLYKKHQWQVTGSSFYPLRLLFEKHCAEQSILADQLAGRIMALNGVPVAMAHDVAEITKIARPPIGRKGASREITRLLDAHETILTFSHGATDMADLRGDGATRDLIAGDIVRLNEFQVWALLQHQADIPRIQNGS